jgi:hypothetical protein
MNITDISTPALIVDQVKFQCNAEKMSALLENNETPTALQIAQVCGYRPLADEKRCDRFDLR